MKISCGPKVLSLASPKICMSLCSTFSDMRRDVAWSSSLVVAPGTHKKMTLVVDALTTATVGLFGDCMFSSLLLFRFSRTCGSGWQALPMMGQRLPSTWRFDILPALGETSWLAAVVESERSVAGDVLCRNGHIVLDWRRRASMMVNGTRRRDWGVCGCESCVEPSLSE